jgi:hypothetical protein
MTAITQFLIIESWTGDLWRLRRVQNRNKGGKLYNGFLEYVLNLVIYVDFISPFKIFSHFSTWRWSDPWKRVKYLPRSGQDTGFGVMRGRKVGLTPEVRTALGRDE